MQTRKGWPLFNEINEGKGFAIEVTEDFDETW
jgi:hypothetical protein